MHVKKLLVAGKEIKEAEKALIMLHGRGAPASSILGLATHLQVSAFALLAPEATNNTWYPFSFLAASQQNEPWLSSSIQLLEEVVADINDSGIDTSRIYFTGFSQGACLCLEFVARNARRYGGVAAFTGGLIGDKIEPGKYKGDFQGTPIFIGSSNPDIHVPVERVYASANILRDMNARVTEKLYENMGHTINADEIENANRLIFDLQG